MNSNLLSNVLLGGRRSGKTTALAKACKEANGLMLCFSAQEAARVAREYGVRTASVECPELVMGQDHPVLIDSSAAGMVIDRLQRRIGQLELKLARARAALDDE